MTIISNAVARQLVERVENILYSKGYVFFDSNLAWNLNIIGVRARLSV